MWSCQEFRSQNPGTCDMSHPLHPRTQCCLYLDSNSSAFSEQVGPWAFWHVTWQAERGQWWSGFHCFPWADTFDSRAQKQILELKLKDRMVINFHNMNTQQLFLCLPSFLENEQVRLLSQPPQPLRSVQVTPSQPVRHWRIPAGGEEGFCKRFSP